MVDHLTPSPRLSDSSRLSGLPGRPRVRRSAMAVFAAGVVVLAACGGSTATGGAAVVGSKAAATDASGSTDGGVVTQSGGASLVSPGALASPSGSAATTNSGPFPGGVLIADEGNNRIIVVNNAGHILWRFPAAGSLPAGQQFSADDAFIDPNGLSIVANDEEHQVLDRIDIATRKVVWQYGHYNRMSSQIGYLHTPDDAYPLANGDVVVADIQNCRVLEIAPSKAVVRQWGRTGACRDHPPATYGRPNGDTPLPDGGLLITEIIGSRVVRLSATGAVLFDIHVPVRYPSDAQLDANGNVVVADYSSRGQVVAVSPTGKLLWRYGPRSGRGRLDHPSLATPLPNGLVSINDDFRHRIVVIDPRTGQIVWQYGHTDVPGRGPGYLNVPDGHQPLPAGLIW